MKKWRNRLIATVSVFASVGLLYGLVLSIICKGVASSETAGWAQAIGAVAAIGVAIWIPYDQRKIAALEEKKELLEAKKQLADHDVSLAIRVRAVAVEVAIHLERIEKSTRLASDDYRKYDPLLTRDLLNRMAQIEAEEANPTRAIILFDVRDFLVGAHTIVNGVDRPWESLTAKSREDLKRYAQSAERVNMEAHVHLDKAKQQRKTFGA